MPTLHYERKAKRQGYRLIAGIDEAGRGPLAGPVVAACVILKKHRFRARVIDSKKLTPKARDIAYLEITKHSIWSTGIINHRMIDKHNIRQATMMAMEKAITTLSTPADYILVDGKMILDVPLPAQYLTRGEDKSLSIAAASIIAKVTRDRIMLRYHRRFPKYGFDHHKGYGTKAHIQALATHGPCTIHRRTFHPLRHCEAA